MIHRHQRSTQLSSANVMRSPGLALMLEILLSELAKRYSLGNEAVGAILGRLDFDRRRGGVVVIRP